MTEKSAFMACFTDWRLVKGRKVVQVVLEIPIEQADQAYQVLGGMPDPGSSVWCAVARLKQGSLGGSEGAGQVVPSPLMAGNPLKQESEVVPTDYHQRTVENAPASAPEQPARARKAFREMSYAQQAGILCADKKFWRFLTEDFEHFQVQSEDDAVSVVRNICLVDSRRDIIPGSVAARAWRELVDRYRVWEMVPV